MKKNNPYITDDEIDLADLVRTLWREKILILSISIICGLLGYLYATIELQELKSEITLKNPPVQIFEPYNLLNIYNNNNNNNNNNNIAGQFISDFKLNFLSLDNLQSFMEESRDFDNFKRNLKSRNISAKEYFVDKIGEVKDKNIIISNKYFLNHTKEVDGAIFLNKYVEFIKKKLLLSSKII
jgi:LPS O-antigen subunit length determinant protein (WzzB/FepE family)